MTQMDVRRSAAGGDRMPVDTVRADRRIAPDKLASSRVHLAQRENDTLPKRASTFVATLVVGDLVAITAALLFAHVGRFGLTDPHLFRGLSAIVISAVIGIGWVSCMALQGAYEPRFLGVGGEEYRRVTKATFTVFAVMAIGSYLLKIELARGFVGLAFPSGLLLLLLGRFSARQWLVRQRAVGRLCHQVLVMGDRESVCDFVAQLRQEPSAGFTVIGACLPDKDESMRHTDRVPVLGDYSDIARVARSVGADVVAVTASESISPDRLRRVAWSLEGTDIDLVVAPAVTDVAGPRVTVRQVAGLPLLYVDEPRFTGVPRLVKGSIDRVGALLGLLVLGLPLLVVAGLVRLTSPAPRCSGRVGSASTARSSASSSSARCTGTPRSGGPGYAHATRATVCSSRSATTRASPAWAACSVGSRSTSCPSCSTSCAATCRWSDPGRWPSTARRSSTTSTAGTW